LVLAKVLTHTVLAGLPLLLMAPVISIQYGLHGSSILVLLLSLLIGLPVLMLVGSVGAALTLGVRGAGVLLSLLVLPLYVPVLIFGAGAVEADAAGLGAGGHLSVLAALLVLAVFFVPLATAAALRIALE
jgi:heme exporter protein B